MKTRYKYFASGCLLLLMTLSCNESYLEIEPYGSVSENTLANEQGVDLLLIGAYSLLDGGGTVGGNYLGGIGRLRGGDEVTQGTETGPSIFNAMMFTEADGDIESKWRNLYSAVGRCNDVLKMLAKVEDSTPEHLLEVEAEAKFLRGVYYLYLAMFFRNVPWIDETINYAERNFFVSNTEDIYPKIEADFSFAADNLTETKGQVGRANKWAAKAFLAKTYMFQDKFAEAK